MPTDTFTAVTDPLKAASETIKSMVKLRDATAFMEKSVVLQQQIADAYLAAISAHESQMTLQQRNQELETEMVKLKDWEAQKQRYELKTIPPGVFVRTLKPEKANGEPLHNICECCYQKGIHSTLQSGAPSNGVMVLRCSNGCPELRTGHFSAPTHARMGRGGPNEWMR